MSADHDGLLLAGDIGGTKTALALYSRAQGPRLPIAEATFSSHEYETLEAIVAEFLTANSFHPTRACFGIAGPVLGGHARLTNLTWEVDAPTLQREFDLSSVRLLNDLESIANAIPFLDPSDLETINPGKALVHGPIAVIAPGTGLGEGYLVWTGSRYQPVPSEGGHASFAAATDLEVDLLRYLHQFHHHVSFERVCSGMGIPNLYTFLRDTGRYPEPDWLRDELAGVEDITPIVMQAAVDKKADLCVAMLDLFISILGGEAGNLALKILSTGGVHLAGGIPPRILPQLRDGAFLSALTHKGRFRPLLTEMPVHVIVNREVAIFGVACNGLEVQPA